MNDTCYIKDPSNSNNKSYIFNSGQGYGTCATTTSTAGARIVTLNGYEVVKGFVAVKFTYSVPQNATMNINNKGEYTIKYNGSNLAADVIKGGDISMFYFDGNYYNLITRYSEYDIQYFSYKLFDLFYANANDVATDVSSNEKYLLLYGSSSELGSGIVNGTIVLIDFTDTYGSVEDLISSGLTDFQFKFEDGNGKMYTAETIGGTLRTSDLYGVKRITLEYLSVDDCFSIVSVEHYVTDTMTQNSNALITSGAVYSVVGDVESILDAIINGSSRA